MRIGSGHVARRHIGAALVLALTLVAVIGVGAARADTTAIAFEGPAYAPGSVDGQDGWSSTGSYDQEVVANTYGIASFGAQSLRISNAVTSGSFGDQTFSRSLGDEAGETSAENGGLSGGTRRSSFQASWSFASTVPGAEQPGLSVVVSPDRGDGARMSWVQLADTPAGLAVNFYDYRDGDFAFTNVASGLSRSATHTVELTMYFVEGPANDIVEVCVDGTTCHTGTSWEDYFREVEGNPTRTVDSLLFRAGGDAAPATLGKGFLVDNLTLATSDDSPTACVFTTSGTTMTLTNDCTTDRTILVPDGFTLDGDGHSITAVDPAGDHFRGAVVRNGGSSANVTDVEITASELADVCDAGDDRLRGILLDGAAGSITDVNVHGVRQGLSGCQEGNAIEARNFTSTTTVAVTVADSRATDYQKAGVVVNGQVSATVTGNVVAGDGPVDYIAQNGIQIGFGAAALVRENSVSGNFYSPEDWVACGLLFFEANGVKQQANTLFANERNLCNFGRGGGNPSR